ncbi:MAG: hypothetical protein U1E81_09775 [Xanthobacteraceae bacterium]
MDDKTNRSMWTEVQLARANSGRAAKNAQKIAILVVGMHRSGTSAIARTLNLLGCDLPKTLVPPGVGNTLGHWESAAIMALNDEILVSAGSTWDDFEPFNPAWYSSPLKEAYSARAGDTLASEFGFSRLFILKDPRICRLLPFWIEALEAFCAKPLLVIPVRNPSDVAASLEKRDGMEPSVGQLLWLRHMLDAEFNSRGFSRAFIRYDELLVRWHAVTRQLGDDWGITWPRQSTAVKSAIDNFLAETHRHHETDDGHFLANPRLSRWIRSTFEIFDRWTRGNIYETDSNELDRIREAFEEAIPAFALPLLAVKTIAKLRIDLAVARQRLLRLESDIAERDTALAQRDAQLGELGAALSASNEALETRTVRINDLVSSLAARQSDLAANRVLIQELENVNAVVARELAKTKDRTKTLDASLSVRERSLATKIARIKELQEVNLATVIELTKAKDRCGTLEASMAAREADLTANNARFLELQETNAIVKADLVTATNRYSVLESAAAAREAEMNASTTALVRSLSERDTEIASLQCTAAERETRVEMLEGTILSLRTSTSWWISAPLRGFADLLRYSFLSYPLALSWRALLTMSWSPFRDWKAARVIARSNLFDTDWYRRAYPDVAASRINPVLHYVTYGAREGRDPGPSFSSRGYLECNPDVAASGINPLVHYLLYGASQGRVPSGKIKPTTLRADRIIQAPPKADVAPSNLRVPGCPNDAVITRFAHLRPLPVYQVFGDSAMRITMVTDSINAGSLYGGVATAIILSVSLARKLNARLRIVTLTEPPVRDNIATVLACHGIEWNKNIEFETVSITGAGYRPCDITPNDIFVTTSWWSTANVTGATTSNRIIYLLQEDERLFYPGGDEQLRCREMLASQSIDFVVNSQLLYNYFINQGFANISNRGVWFEPAFPQESYYFEHTPRDRRNFVFYARPKNLRNLYFRGIEVINAALRADIFNLAEWHFTFVGRDLDEVSLERNVKPRLLQNLPWNEYASFIRQSDLGLSLMYTPHPSYPPLDLAASGAVAVTNRFGPKHSLDSYSKNLICVDSDIGSLVEGLRIGVELSCDSARRLYNYERCNIQRRWDKALEPVIDQLVRAEICTLYRS